MGTRGYYIFKYNGIYYVFYNHFDSYYDGLGQEIVEDIRQLTDSDFADIKAALENITEEDIDNPYNSCRRSSKFPGLKESVIYSERFSLHYVGEEEPVTDVFIEYVYIVDLDNDVFIVKSYDTKLQHPLREIPADWWME